MLCYWGPAAKLLPLLEVALLGTCVKGPGFEGLSAAANILHAKEHAKNHMCRIVPLLLCMFATVPSSRVFQFI